MIDGRKCFRHGSIPACARQLPFPPSSRLPEFLSVAQGLRKVAAGGAFNGSVPLHRMVEWGRND
ncbi:hypothetical protein CXU22_00995 [Akkermansia muciniphila]|uniref:Uncharacterized protein n=1 Tax=Akkermansia muciniphila TaxID=239935 RepID=A0A2N8HH44_9BACT|nr:hypothetical protein CXU22_00995 [Akkermansia muciniphila]